MNTDPDQQAFTKDRKMVNKDFVIQKYEDTIKGYKSAADKMEKNFKFNRYLPVILGGFISLLSTLSITSFVESLQSVRVGLALGTIILASVQAMLNELLRGQNWGDEWKRLTLHAYRIEREYYRAVATPEVQMNVKRELDLLSILVLEEKKSAIKSILNTTEDVPIDRPDLQ